MSPFLLMYLQYNTQSMSNAVVFADTVSHNTLWGRIQDYSAALKLYTGVIRSTISTVGPM